MADLLRNNYKCTISNSPGTSGAFTISGAVSSTDGVFVAGDDGISVAVRASESGVGQEIRTGCVYTHSGTSLSRGTLEGGSALNFTSACVVEVVATAAWGNAQELATQSHISGLAIAYASTSSITCSPGSAYIESLGRVYTVASTITLSGLSALTASTLYHVYLYDNAGTPTLEASTTAPATAYAGTARSKTSDTSRRYIGTFRTNASGSNNVEDFVSFSKGVELEVIYKVDAISSPYRVLNGATKQTTAQSIDLSSLAPANVTTAVFVTTTIALSTGTNGSVNMAFTFLNNASTRFASLGGMVINTSDYPGLPAWLPVLPSLNPAFYWYNLAGDSANSAVYVDLSGFKVAR